MTTAAAEPGTPVRVLPVRVDARRVDRISLDDLASAVVLPEFLERVPIEYVRRTAVAAVMLEPDGNPIAIAGEETNWTAVDAIGRLMGRPLRRVVLDHPGGPAAASAAVVSLVGHSLASRGETTATLTAGLATGDSEPDLATLLMSREDLLGGADRAPVVRLVNGLLREAVRMRASDVHLQPYEERLVARYRVDGVLEDAFDVPKALQDETLSRLKIMGSMDIAERRLPQDGRATVRLGERDIDLRIASLPTSHGERIVVRLLDYQVRRLTLDDLGMTGDILDSFREFVALEHGIVLVTGPTGSGKTTTLYAALLGTSRRERNVLTIEDPIEYQLDGISQTQVNEKKGMTFARALRSVLRQDPDVIMVGEIRDHDTAVMAVQAALTGHLVFSTLHTNDSAGAVSRLLDLGIEPFLAASSLCGVLAQRLVRRVCPKCWKETVAGESARRWLGLETDDPPTMIANAVGCDACRGGGYRGRSGIFELMQIDDGVRGMIHERSPSGRIKAAARARGMRTLRESGVARVLDRITTIEEVERVTSQAHGAAGMEV